MNFDLSEEQDALREMAREFLSERWSADRMRAALDKPPARIDDALYDEIVSMGWLGVTVSEEAGGIGGDVMTAAVLCEASGYGLLAGPFESALISAIALDRSGDAALRPALGKGLLADLIAGRTRVTMALDDAGGGWGAANPRAEVVEAGGEGGWQISGAKILVPDADGVDYFLVSARTPLGSGLVLVPAKSEGIGVQAMRVLDARASSEVVFENVRVGPEALLGGPGGAARLLAACADIWTALCAADLLGTAQACLDLSTRYATERVQFGRPIGSFQAVSHRLADTLVDVEIGRSLVYAACLALDEERDNAPALVSAAKAWLSEAAVRAAETALQIHGGVGFTWEYDVHLHLRRARCNAARLGDVDQHRDRVADGLDGALQPPQRSSAA